jgi:hypothetical protein
MTSPRLLVHLAGYSEQHLLLQLVDRDRQIRMRFRSRGSASAFIGCS